MKQKQLKKMQEEKENKQPPLSKRSVQSIGSKNVGDYLYYKGQKQKEEQQRLIEQKKLESLKQQEENLTFHPQISDKSNRIVVSVALVLYLRECQALPPAL